MTVVAHELRGFVPVGGMGTATTFLTLALARMGHAVEILLGVNRPESIDPYWGDVYEGAGIRFRAAPPLDDAIQPPEFKHARSIELGLREEPPDVVVAHDFGAPAYTALRVRQAALAFEDTLFVVFCHGTRRWVLDMTRSPGVADLEQVLAVSVLERASIELADVVVSPSEYMVDWMRAQGWCLPERTLVVPYFTRAGATGEDSGARPLMDHRGPVERIAFFGRLEEKKGIKAFVAALNALGREPLAGRAVEFIGKPTSTWSRDRVEALFSDATRRALRQLTFEGGLDQPAALARLMQPGTLAVMPSLGDNSPNTVYECLEQRIPFLASNAGGIPELVVPEDRGRVLFDPTPQGVESALRRVLMAPQVPEPPRPAFDGEASYRRWAEVINMRATPRHVPTADGTVDIVVVHRRSREALARCLASLERQTHTDFRVTVAAAGRAAPDGIPADVVLELDSASIEIARQAGLRAGSAPYVVFLDEEDVADHELLKTLVRAQAASGADVVSCGLVLVADDGGRTLRFFSVEAGGLGVLSNVYGNVALFRRSVLDDLKTARTEHDADWPLLARLDVSRAGIVSVPVALVTRSIQPGRVDRDPSDALLALAEIESALLGPFRSTARLAAGLAANARAEARAPAAPARFPRRALRRLLRSVR